MRDRTGGRCPRPLYRRPHDRARTTVVVAIAAAVTLLSAGPVAARVDAEGCTDLDSIPVEYVIDYQSAIQGIFNDRCVSCHSPEGGPPAGLDLTQGGSWSHIYDVPSSQDPSFIRVLPNQPYQSLLFLKVNCDTPGVGHRMPFGQEPLSADEQALILDWIAGGAPSTETDGIFRSGFETRG